MRRSPPRSSVSVAAVRPIASPCTLMVESFGEISRPISRSPRPTTATGCSDAGQAGMRGDAAGGIAVEDQPPRRLQPARLRLGLEAEPAPRRARIVAADE